MSDIDVEKYKLAMAIVYPTRILFELGGQAEEVQFWYNQPYEKLCSEYNRMREKNNG